jgi:hypothetical protein
MIKHYEPMLIPLSALHAQLATTAKEIRLLLLKNRVRVGSAQNSSKEGKEET